MKRPILFLINVYRKRLSGQKKAPCCRYFPSCSNYAYRAVNEWGSIIGLIMGGLRILRCNPLFPTGADPVPRRRRKMVPKTAPLGRKIATVDKTLWTYKIDELNPTMIGAVNAQSGRYTPYLTHMEYLLQAPTR